MAVLSIETSGFTGGVAVSEEGGPWAELTVGSKSTYSRRLMRAIIFILEETGLGWKDIDTVAVSLGPGSFTGLRIGLSTAKGLCLATGAAIVGVPTLDILAQNAALAPKDSLICPVIDARRGQIYCALYRPGQGLARRISDYLVINPRELVGKVSETCQIVFLGTGLAPYKQTIAELFGNRAVIAPKHLWYPRPFLCANMGKEMIKAGQGPQDPVTLSPLYLRLSEAEEKKKANEEAD